MAVARDLCIKLANSEHYKILKDRNSCLFDFDEARDTLITLLDSVSIEQYEKVLDIDLSQGFTSDVESKIKSMSDKKNLGTLTHMFSFLGAMDRNVKKYMPVLYDIYQVVNHNALVF